MTLILNGTDNSATVPAVQGGTAGTSTGLYYPSTNQVAISTAGTQAVFVNASQQVGIGASTLTAKLTINGNTIAYGSAPYYALGAAYNDTTAYLQYTASTKQLNIQCADGTTGGFTTFGTGNGNERMRIDASGNVGIGTSSPSTYSAKFVSYGAFGTSTPAISLVNSSAENVNNVAETQYWLTNSFSGLVNVAKIGAISGSTGNQYGALYFSTSNAGAPTERMRIDSTGNVLVTNPAGLGYGTGSGGTVTQATSKSTGVTLNKPTGQITMNAAALAANTTVAFTFNNSIIAATDTMVIHVQGGITGYGNYIVSPTTFVSGVCVIAVTNRSAGSLSEAIVLTYAVIKGATS